jgi:hypothetical protein
MAEPDDKPLKLTRKQINALLHSPATVAAVTKLANRLCDSANAMSADLNRPSAQGRPNYGVYVKNDPQSKRARAFVHPLGRTGIHVEAAQSAMLKSIGGLGLS